MRGPGEVSQCNCWPPQRPPLTSVAKCSSPGAQLSQNSPPPGPGCGLHSSRCPSKGPCGEHPQARFGGKGVAANKRGGPVKARLGVTDTISISTLAPASQIRVARTKQRLSPCLIRWLSGSGLCSGQASETDVLDWSLQRNSSAIMRSSYASEDERWSLRAAEPPNRPAARLPICIEDQLLSLNNSITEYYLVYRQALSVDPRIGQSAPALTCPFHSVLFCHEPQEWFLAAYIMLERGQRALT